MKCTCLRVRYETFLSYIAHLTEPDSRTLARRAGPRTVAASLSRDYVFGDNYLGPPAPNPVVQRPALNRLRAAMHSRFLPRRGQSGRPG